MKLKHLGYGDWRIVSYIIDSSIDSRCEGGEHQSLADVCMMGHMDASRRIPLAEIGQSLRNMGVALTIDEGKPYNAQP